MNIIYVNIRIMYVTMPMGCRTNGIYPRIVVTSSGKKGFHNFHCALYCNK